MPDGAGTKLRPLSWLMAAQECSKLPEKVIESSLGFPMVCWNDHIQSCLPVKAPKFLKHMFSEDREARVTEGAGCCHPWQGQLPTALQERGHSWKNPFLPSVALGLNTLWPTGMARF